jgi:hypothetical protein
VAAVLAVVAPEAVEQWEQLWIVPGLAGGEDDLDRESRLVDGQVDLAGQSASGSPDGFAVDGNFFDSGRASPFFRASAAC